MHSRTIQAGSLLLALVCGTASFGQGPSGPPREETGVSDASPPYEFLDSAGLPQGVNVDLVRALARVAGKSLEIRLGKWNDIRQEMEAGRIDLMSVACTEERRATSDSSTRRGPCVSPSSSPRPESVPGERHGPEGGARCRSGRRNDPRVARGPMLGSSSADIRLDGRFEVAVKR